MSEFVAMDMLARRYGYRGPFDPQLVKDMQNPYRMALLRLALTEIKTEENAVVELIGKHLPETLLNLFDGHGTQIIRALGGKGASKVKHIFNKPQEKKYGKEISFIDKRTGKKRTIITH